MTVLLAAAAVLLLLGSVLVVQTLIEIDVDERRPVAPGQQPRPASHEQRRAA